MIEIVKLNMVAGIFRNNTYIVINKITNECVVIDPAWELTKIIDQIREKPLNLRAILLTHGHYDHTNLSMHLVKKYDCKVYISKLDQVDFTFKCPNITFIDKFEDICIGGIIIRPIHTPGHTQGSVCYLIDDKLFSGDTLFIEGCGMCTGKGADPIKMFYSLKILKSSISPATMIFPGHSFKHQAPKSYEFVFHNNIYMQFGDNDLNHFIAFRMRKDQKNLFNFI